MRFLTWLATNAVALAAAAWLLDGIYFDGATSGCAEVSDKLVPLLVVAADPRRRHVVREAGAHVPVDPVHHPHPGPVPAGHQRRCMLLLTGWLAGEFDVGFHVDGLLDRGRRLDRDHRSSTWVVDSLLSERDR